MYEAFFGLRQPAFSLTADPRFLWLSDAHRDGLSALCYGISRRKGILLLTGDIGSGKTTLVRAALERLPADLLDVPEVSLIAHTAELTPLDLLKYACSGFGIGGPQFPVRRALETPADYVIALTRFLTERLRAGMTCVLVVDEAHNLSLSALEQLRLLSNLEVDAWKLLQIALIGQTELLAKIADPRLRQLRQRVAVEYHLGALRAADVGAYLRHRIQQAGGRLESVFAAGCERHFVEFSNGCPRLVNVLADQALLAAYAKQIRPVLPVLVEGIARQLCFHGQASSGAAPPRPRQPARKQAVGA